MDPTILDDDTARIVTDTPTDAEAPVVRVSCCNDFTPSEPTDAEKTAREEARAIRAERGRIRFESMSRTLTAAEEAAREIGDPEHRAPLLIAIARAWNNDDADYNF